MVRAALPAVFDYLYVAERRDETHGPWLMR